MGHDFCVNGTPHQQWFHIAPNRAVLAVGLYRESAQLVWIDTGLPICAG